MDDGTKREIDKVVRATLRDAGIVRPPVQAEDVLERIMDGLRGLADDAL